MLSHTWRNFPDYLSSMCLRLLLVIVCVFPYVTTKTYSYISLDRPSGFQEVEAPRISRQSAHEGGKVVSPTHRPPLPPGDIRCTHPC
jgi:hypothetical protein